MATGVTVHRISGGSIYFSATPTERFQEPDLHTFETVREAVNWIRSIRSGWRYDYNTDRWTRVTRNHLTATLYDVRQGGQWMREQETYRLDSLPEWITSAIDGHKRECVVSAGIKAYDLFMIDEPTGETARSAGVELLASGVVPCVCTEVD